MSDPILVRGEISSGVAWSRTLIPLGVILAAVLYWLVPDIPVGLILGVVFGVAWIWVELYAARQRMRQLWVSDTGDGFDLIDRTGTRHFPDEGTSSVALKLEGVFSNGIQTATRRVFTVWSDLEAEPILLESKLKAQQADRLAPLIHRILESFQKRTEIDLAKGEVLAGVAWRLDSTTLTFGKGDAKQSIPRSEVAACEEFDGHICVWRRGQDEALVKFKVGTRNVCLLPALLKVVAAEGISGKADDQTTLGRILFERKPSAGTCVTLQIVGAFLSLVGVVFVVAGLIANNEPALLPVGLVLVVGGIALAFGGYALRFQAFRCQERGVVQTGLRGKKELRYEDTGAFTYSATRHYHNGAYVGTAIGMNFTPLPESNAPKISYKTTIKNEDAAIEELRNFISQAIACRMAQRLAAGQEVAWTPNLTFIPQGIRYRPPGILGRKDAKELSHADYGGWNMEQGVFYLFRKGEKKAVSSEQTSAVNFYPGFFLLLMQHEEA